jgi:hypothetical protein
MGHRGSTHEPMPRRELRATSMRPLARHCERQPTPASGLRSKTNSTNVDEHALSRILGHERMIATWFRWSQTLSVRPRTSSACVVVSEHLDGRIARDVQGAASGATRGDMGSAVSSFQTGCNPPGCRTRLRCRPDASGAALHREAKGVQDRRLCLGRRRARDLCGIDHLFARDRRRIRPGITERPDPPACGIRGVGSGDGPLR